MSIGFGHKNICKKCKFYFSIKFFMWQMDLNWKPWLETLYTNVTSRFHGVICYQHFFIRMNFHKNYSSKEIVKIRKDSWNKSTNHVCRPPPPSHPLTKTIQSQQKEFSTRTQDNMIDFLFQFQKNIFFVSFCIYCQRKKSWRN